MAARPEASYAQMRASYLGATDVYTHSVFAKRDSSVDVAFYSSLPQQVHGDASVGTHGT